MLHKCLAEQSDPQLISLICLSHINPLNNSIPIPEQAQNHPLWIESIDLFISFLLFSYIFINLSFLSYNIET